MHVTASMATMCTGRMSPVLKLVVPPFPTYKLTSLVIVVAIVVKAATP